MIINNILCKQWILRMISKINEQLIFREMSTRFFANKNIENLFKKIEVEKKTMWVNWHEMINVNQDQLHVFCKNCEFAFIYFTSKNIDNNKLNKHQSNNEYVVKKNKKIEKQNFWKKNF